MVTKSVSPKRGDVVNHNGRQTWLIGACDSLNVAYYCVTHQQSFPTRSHCVEHVKSEGEHQIVRWCSAHGLEAPTPKPETVPATEQEDEK